MSIFFSAKGYILMVKQSAAAMVREIRAETARRARIWRLMRVAGREALRAVRANARSRGVLTLDWLGYDNDLAVNVCYQTDETQPVKYFLLNRDGRVFNDSLEDEVYERYPNLTKEDPVAFKKAAVERLMGALNDYRKLQRDQRRQRSCRRK